VGVLKLPKLGFPWLWRPITLCTELWLRWGLKKSFSPCQEISNGMWHVTYTKGNQGDSWLLVVGSQIGNLICSFSFDHNLCFKYPNGSWKPILDIYIPRTFQWYSEFFNPMGFDPCYCSLKIWESIRSQLPKWEFTWECGGSFLHTLPHFRGHEMWFLGSILGSHLCKSLLWLWAQG
jgi:hypothetical protein